MWEAFIQEDRQLRAFLPLEVAHSALDFAATSQVLFFLPFATCEPVCLPTSDMPDTDVHVEARLPL